MKADWSKMEPFRLQTGQFASKPGDRFGFFVTQRGGRQVRAMVDDGEETGWEHVSVSVLYKNDRGKITYPMPTWDEMCILKNAFWGPEECVVQYHPPEEDYVNIAVNCLHLWKQRGAEFPMPPKICV